MSPSSQAHTLIDPNVVAIVVQQGKILDFVDGVTQRAETPEEYVRQETLKSLVREYDYAKRNIAVEFTLRLGSRKPRADIVLFYPGKPHEQDEAYIIVECKADTVKSSHRTEGIGQLQSYLSASVNAKYGMWTNGIERFCYRKIQEDGKFSYEEIPDVPTFGRNEDEAERPRFDQLKPANSDALLFAFRRSHNYIAGNQGLQKLDAFWELLKLIFCKIYDERHSDEIEFYAASTERHGINGPHKVKARIERLFNSVKADFPNIFKPTETLELNPTVLSYLVSQLQMYSLLESDTDVKGRAYEEIVGSNLRGDRGEFFTPRNICKMAVAMLDPTDHDVILDPACGTGGFLITAMNHVVEKIRQNVEGKRGTNEQSETVIRERIHRFTESKVIGIDLNPNLVKATKMNMVMNNDGSGGLYQGNSLANPMTWEQQLRERKLLGSIDLIFTNPPFGSKIPIDDPSILENYDLGHNWSYDATTDQWTKTGNLQRSQPPEILFIERCVRFLKPGSGRMAVVLPDGILGSPGLGYVREWILQQTRVLASVDLHADTFQPNVSVQTSVLVLQRKSADEIVVETASKHKNSYNVFMAIADHIGHDKRGNKTYVRDSEGNEVIEELDELIKEYENEQPVYSTQRTRRKIEDDNTLQIAQEFRDWLLEQG